MKIPIDFVESVETTLFVKTPVITAGFIKNKVSTLEQFEIRRLPTILSYIYRK